MGDTNGMRFGDIELMDTRNVGTTPEEHMESQDVMYENTDGLEPPRREPSTSHNDKRQPGTTPEEQMESQDIMYENTDGLEPPRREPSTSHNDKRQPGIQKWLSHRTAICLLLCLVLFTVIIVLIVRYIPLSSNPKQPEATYHILEINVTETPRGEKEFLEPLRREMSTTKTELKETHLELEKALQEIRDLKNLLLSCQREDQNATTNRPTTEEVLKHTRLGMDQREIEFCPEGWVLFKKTCLWISTEQNTWRNSSNDCEERDSNLIIVPWNDTALQHFLAGEQGGFWVGKELTWKWPEEWRWPGGYGSTLRDRCWTLSGGTLRSVTCSDNHRWICERNIVLTSYKGSSYSNLEFSLWRANFSCYRKSS
ncbi:uncharacterized protein [Aquarana catesbeiana]|uniref:uncharacterized protein isoform X2 n=1 Tax=Aquarana catesbeiana TaxID=8400 RepID=UPI003CC997AF